MDVYDARGRLCEEPDEDGVGVDVVGVDRTTMRVRIVANNVSERQATAMLNGLARLAFGAQFYAITDEGDYFEGDVWEPDPRHEPG